ncbi:MAG: PIN domain-containing protein [Thermomicrobiales bacterium]|nr:PIN domain-containing protein [Thermomicrobiales bacterium]
MIFLDTNFLVRLLVVPRSDQELEMVAAAASLMRGVLYGTREVTTSDAVLSEVVFVLSGAVYHTSRENIADGLTRLIQLPAFRSPDKVVWLEAIRLWTDRTSLSFVDALAASYSIHRRHQLATFDRKLAKTPGVTLYALNEAG